MLLKDKKIFSLWALSEDEESKASLNISVMDSAAAGFSVILNNT